MRYKMREMFFRGKSIINGEWHYGYYVIRWMPMSKAPKEDN